MALDGELLCWSCIIFWTWKFTSGQFTFTSSPGTQRTQERNSVDLTWGLSSLAVVDTGDIHLSQTMILQYKFGTPTYHNGYTNISAPFLFNPAAKTVSVRITSVNKNTDAGQYSCTHTSFSTGGSTKTNSTAVIYVYGKPSGASITPSAPVMTEGNNLQLVCQSQSTSEPAAYRPDPSLTYRWYRDSDDVTDSPPDRHSISGNQLTITGVQRGDSIPSYSCQSQEAGGLQSNLSPGVNINVQYSPGQSTTTTPTITDVFEGQDEVVMRCSATDLGNPLSQYTWSKDGSSQGTTPTGTRTIAAADLSVNNHDGNWQCRAVNTIGQGPPADISLTVYSLPVITSPPSGSGPYEVEAENRGSLSVLCSTRGRPPPVVSWTYNGGGLPNGIESVAESDSTSGKLTTVNRRLRWTAGSTLEQRRLTGGDYTCTGVVLTETPATITVEIDVQYGSYNTGISPSEDQTVIENSALSLTCTSSCNPACSYTWTRPGQTTSQGSVLSFPAIKRTDHGQYSCRANNGRGQPQEKDIFIAVHYPPEPSITLSPAGVLVEGKSVTVTCTVDSQPESSITWTNITDQQPPVYDNINTNTTHSIIRFSAINILDSATLHCIADNSVTGSPKQSPAVLEVYGPARTHRTVPTDRRVGARLGENTNFTVWVIANPIPSPGEWSWKYYPQNVTAERTIPPNVILTVDREKAFLSLTNITKAHYGNYSMTTTNSYGGWDEGEVIFQLTAYGKPSDPRNFQVIKTTAVSITLQWVTGFNGGLPQTFTISYHNMNTGVTLEETGIPDVGSSSGKIMSKKITRGIDDNTPYELQIKAVNEIDFVEGQITSSTTPAKATVGSKPTVITLFETTADITLYVTGQLTHVDIKNCVSGKETCSTATVVVADRRKKRHGVGSKHQSGTVPAEQNLRQEDRVNRRVKRQESEVLELTATVELSDATANKFTFQFFVFDGEDLVSENIAPMEEARPGGNNSGVIAGAVVAAFLVFSVVIIVVVLWRKGIIFNKGSQATRNVPMIHYENSQVMSTLHNEGYDQESVVNTYESINEDRTQNPGPNIYDGLASQNVRILPSNSSTVVGVINEGTMFKVSLAKSRKYALHKTLVVKSFQENQYLNQNAYLEAAAEVMVKLVNCDNVIKCLGISENNCTLFMEHAPIGNLRQYLLGVFEGNYVNTTSERNRELITFLHQTINGVTAVAELQPPALFYCLCCEHVLLGDNKVCKLTGFSSAKAVRDREQEEDRLGLPRPVRWLAPEAIDVKHSTQSDVWGFGVLMWEILSLGKRPYDVIEDTYLKEHVKRGFTDGKPECCSDDMFDLMQKTWMKKPENRITLPQIQTALLESTIYQNA